QPTAEDSSTLERDLSLWLTLCREYAEEYLGVEEAEGAAGGALSFTEDEAYASLYAAYELGAGPGSVLGLGLDPLTLCPELVTVAVVDAAVFDELFGAIPIENSEGSMRGAKMKGGQVVGYAFDERSVLNLLTAERLSPATTAALTRAWEFR